MVARSQGRQYADKRRNSYTGAGYVQGSTARQLSPVRKIKEPERRTSNIVRKNREKARHMNPGYVLFLVAALTAAGFILIGYIRLQADIVGSMNHIASLENELNDLRLSNAEEYSRIESSVDLEKIRQIAMGELGMTYASEGQVITYSSQGSDYVRQVEQIPD